ncbi:MAG: hypothetical protein Kow0010_16890 [Dehalococcoidia bacterium]
MPETRPSIVGVRFRNAGKIEYFHAAGMRLEPGEAVVVETARGPEIARVVIAPDQVVVNELAMEDLHPILRLATDDDIRRADALAVRAHDLLPEARRLAREHGFDARIDGASFTLDGSRLTFSYTTEDRVDYRRFIHAAAKAFAVRVDVRQVGSRDRAKLVGGYGRCGLELCCSSWLSTFPSISIRMAKDQELPLNPEKISGLCGRLLCCLSYEEEGYKEMRRTLPRLGQRCSTPTGEGKVIGVNVLRRQVTLRVGDQRVEVTDRDLGTVVRWDPSARNAPPPPSIPREEALARGLIEPEEEPGPEPEPAWLVGVGTVSGVTRAESPEPAERRDTSQRSRRRRGGRGRAPGTTASPGKQPETRVFKRAARPAPASPSDSGGPTGRPSGDSQRDGGQGRPRRSRRRRGGDGASRQPRE